MNWSGGWRLDQEYRKAGVTLLGLQPAGAQQAASERWRLTDLGRHPRSRKLNQMGRTLRIDTAMLISASVGISRALYDAVKMRTYLADGDHGKLSRRLESDVKALAAFYRYGCLHGSLRLRWGFLQEDLSVNWSQPGDPGLWGYCKEAEQLGAEVDIVTGSAPGWEEPWSRARRGRIDIDYHTVRLGEEVFDRTEVQAIRIVAPTKSDGSWRTRSTEPRCRRVPRTAAMTDAPIFQIHCALRHSDPRVWRRLLVPADLRLDVLHVVLQVAMDWENDHLWQFQTAHAVYRVPDPVARRSIFARKKPLDARRTSLKQIMKNAGDVVLYEYDFGDNWEIDLRLEAVLEHQPGMTYPACTAGACAAPPEDCGGSYGFQRIRDQLADPQHPDHDDALGYVPDGWSAETWDIAKINKWLIGLDKVNEDPVDEPEEDPAEVGLLSAMMELRIRHDHYDLLRNLLAERPSSLPGPIAALDGAEQHRKGRVVRAERRSWNYFLEGLDIGADSEDFRLSFRPADTAR